MYSVNIQHIQNDILHVPRTRIPIYSLRPAIPHNSMHMLDRITPMYSRLPTQTNVTLSFPPTSSFRRWSRQYPSTLQFPTSRTFLYLPLPFRTFLRIHVPSLHCCDIPNIPVPSCMFLHLLVPYDHLPDAHQLPLCLLYHASLRDAPHVSIIP